MKLPGRTDNEIKNVWHTHLKKRLKQSGASPKCESKTARKYEPSYSASTLPESETPGSQPMSPLLSSSEMSSITETLAEATENNYSEVKCEQPDFSTESFPLIDDSLWADPMSSISSGESSDLSAVSGNMEQIQLPFIDSVGINAGESLWNGNHGLNMDGGGTDFWYELLVGAGDLELLPYF